MLLVSLVTCLFVVAAASQWFPASAPSDANSQFFRPVDFPDFQNRFLSQFTAALQAKPNVPKLTDPKRVLWSSVTMFHEAGSKRSWLIVGGTAPKLNMTGTAFRTDFGAVFACDFQPRAGRSGGFDTSSCEILGLDTGTALGNNSDAGLLGKGLQSIQLGDGGGAVVFCDPLWHSSQGTQSPGGKCMVLERTTESWWTARSVEFCHSTGHTQPCAGGFSIDLRLADDGSNVHLLAGLPFAQPLRRVETMENILGRAPQHTQEIESEEEYFGASVAWSPSSSGRKKALAVVGSPYSSVRGYQVDSLAEDIDTQVMDLDADSFGGVGFSVEVALVGKALVVFSGAPFEGVKKHGANTGRVYGQFRDARNSVNFTIDGHRPGEMFGYAIARIGDVDGDGVGEIAISAPALGAENSRGRVYIYRVKSSLEIEKYPLQVLEAPTILHGFGVSLSRSIDIDSDGGPELSVTTLDLKAPVILYSLPPRLRAKCSTKSSSRISPKSIRKGDIIAVKFTINFIDAATGEHVPIPMNFQKRSHQINPDVLWSERFEHLQANPNQTDFIAELLAFKESLKLDPEEPRFQLEEISEAKVGGGHSVSLNVRLRAIEDAKNMELDALPLKVAFRSVLTDPQCDQYTPLCPKAAQPLVDWSECVWKMPRPKNLCPPHPKCSSDLQISVNGGADSHSLVQYGSREDANQSLMFMLRNNGPTKSEDIRVLLRSVGWPTNSLQEGLRVLINRVELRDASTNALLASNEKSNDRWSVNLPSNGAAALISAQHGTILYPDQELFIIVEAFISGLVGSPFEEGGVSTEERLPSPGIVANASSSVEDPIEETNVATVMFDVIYKPQIRFSPGSLLPALVDERKVSPQISASTKVVLGNEVGPQLEHVFLVENSGSTDLHDVSFELEIPIRTDAGDTFLYLTDKARLIDRKASGSDYRWVETLPKMVAANGSEVGICQIEDEFVNPLNLIIREADAGKSSPTGGSNVRRGRSINSENEGESILKASRVPIFSPFGDNRVDIYFKRSGQSQTTISCPRASPLYDAPLAKNLDFKIVCARVVCRLSKLSRADTVRISLSGWLWTPTFFKHNLPDVKFVTRLSVLDWGEPPQILLTYPSIRLDFPDIPQSHELSQTVVFRGITGKYRARMPLWPIIVGIVLGTILLVSLISSLYCRGFFRRRQRTKEAKRKSARLHSRDLKRRSSNCADKESRAPLIASNGSGENGTVCNGSNNMDVIGNPLNNYSNEHPRAYWVDEHSDEKPEPLEIEAVLENGDERENPSPVSSSGLPEWLMNEIKENEAGKNGKKTKFSSKSDS